jgi:hypothetical protein
MAEISEEQRKRDERSTGEAVVSVPLRRTSGVPVQLAGIRLRAKISGGTIVGVQYELVGDEVTIVPSDSWRRAQQLRDEAETVIAKAGKGQHYQNDYLDKLGQQLGVMGGDSQRLTAGVEGVRTSQLRKDALRSSTQSNRGLAPVPDKDAGQRPVQQGQETKELPTREDPLESLVKGIETIRSQAEVRGISNRFAQGEPVSPGEVRRAARRSVEAARRSDAPLGGDLEPLFEVSGSMLAREGKRIPGEGGESTPKEYLDFLSSAMLGLGRQSQLLGSESAGDMVGSAMALGEIKQLQLKKAFEVAKRQSKIGPVYAQYLWKRLGGAEHQRQLLGLEERSEAQQEVLDQMNQLEKMDKKGILEEADDVISRARAGERFDDDYLEKLNDYLNEEPGDQGKKLANALRDAQRSRLKVDVVDVLDRVTKGQQVSELYIDHLQQRAMKLALEDELKRKLSDLQR